MPNAHFPALSGTSFSANAMLGMISQLHTADTGIAQVHDKQACCSLTLVHPIVRVQAILFLTVMFCHYNSWYRARAQIHLKDAVLLF